MNFRNIQAPSSLVMIRPHRFLVNPQTGADNMFQVKPPNLESEALSAHALSEFDRAVQILTQEGVTVHQFDDFGDRNTPDSVFPNNWFSTHHGGRVAIYPMYPPNRRRERRQDVIEMLKAEYRVQEVIDYSGLEQDNLFLEGTGAMVLDHLERLAYVSHSNRANPIILERFCTAFGYEPMVFETADRRGNPIYHTNVMMGIATDFALVCFDLMTNPKRRDEIRERLAGSGRIVIDLSYEQILNFAGNAMELTGRDGRLLALSARAADSLTPDQMAQIKQRAKLLPLAVPTIELAGGSVRCMMAGIHLTRR